MAEQARTNEEMLRRIGLYTGPTPSPEQTLHVSLHTGTPNPTPLTSRAFEAGETVTMESEFTLTEHPENCLDPEHPFEGRLLEMAVLSRRKRADYAFDHDPFSNFRETAAIMRRKGHPNFTALDSVTFNRAQKEVRLEALMANGRMDDTANESVRDSLLDDAVYAVIALALYDEMHAAEPSSS